MQDPQGIAHGIESTGFAIVVIAAVVAMVWHVALRVLLAIAAVAVAVLVASIAVVLLQGVHRWDSRFGNPKWPVAVRIFKASVSCGRRLRARQVPVAVRGIGPGPL
jgi:hypothetical protein